MKRLQRVTASAVESLAVDYELRHGVTVHVHVVPHAAGDLLVLHQGKEHIDELEAVGRSNCLQHFCHEIPEEGVNTMIP